MTRENRKKYIEGQWTGPRSNRAHENGGFDLEDAKRSPSDTKSGKKSTNQATETGTGKKRFSGVSEADVPGTRLWENCNKGGLRK